MKSCSSTLQTFLLNAYTRVYADLYTLTLLGGAVVRWTSSDSPITISGQTWVCGPGIEDQGVNSKVGVNTDALTFKLDYNDNDEIAGAQLADFIMNEGLDGSIIRVDRAWAPSWGDMYGGNIVGTFIRFLGRYSEAQDIGETQATIIVTSPEELLDTSVPAELYSASCLNTFCDANCGLNALSYTATASVSSGTITEQSFPSSLATTAGTYNFGYVLFTSGANAGVQRSIKTQDAEGNLTLIAPFPSAPAPGDAFQAVQGCDLSLNTCISKFNNKVHFRGQPFVPLPATVLGGTQSVVTSTTASGGGESSSSVNGIVKTSLV